MKKRKTVYLKGKVPVWCRNPELKHKYNIPPKGYKLVNYGVTGEGLAFELEAEE